MNGKSEPLSDLCATKEGTTKSGAICFTALAVRSACDEETTFVASCDHRNQRVAAGR
jgi:hypothetical protein